MAALFGETTDFSSLVDESVSDLLAEVEAMESLGAGLESPTSIMKCGEELTDGSITECLSFANGFSPMLDAGKGDALSSTADLNLPYHSNAAEEPFQQAGLRQYHHHQKVFGEHPSRSSEVEFTFSRISWNPSNQFSWDPNC
uniref:Uncharacterized protein n=1 Tax=Lotus japonicus TaxID=34305 RepID=I3S0K0_LOTJA|nr:unknown [Lotus japonicus]